MSQDTVEKLKQIEPSYGKHQRKKVCFSWVTQKPKIQKPEPVFLADVEDF